MDAVEWKAQLAALKAGKLELKIGEHGMSDYAWEGLYELKQYITAVEAGYRATREELAAFRARAGNQTLRDLVENQWSQGACRGYMILAMRQAGLYRKDLDAALECLDDSMELFSLTAAAEEAQRYAEDRDRQPEWVGRVLAAGVDRTWRKAAPGYALQAMRKAGIAPDLAATALDAMELLMEEQSPEDAAAARAAVMDEPDGPMWASANPGETDSSAPLRSAQNDGRDGGRPVIGPAGDGAEPEWIGPSAELRGATQ